MATSALEISVIVPCRGHARELTVMLASLAAQTLSRSTFEVVIVDDGSEPPIVLDADTHHGLELTLLHQHAAGPAAARNLALRHARGHLLVFLNADAILAPDALARHREAHRASGTTRAVLGRFDFLPRHQTPFVRLADALGTLFPYHLLTRDKPLAFYFFWTGNLSVPAAIVRAVGGFDERFRRPLFEDVELGYRLNQVGVPLYFDPDIACDHDHAITLASWLTRAARIGWEWVTFARQHGGAPFPILDGDDAPDDRLLVALLAGLLHQHDAHRARIHELEAMVAEADKRVARGDGRESIDADVLSRGASLLQGINTVERMGGIMAHLIGYAPEDLARYRAGLRPFAVVHNLIEAGDLERTRRILDLCPSDSLLIVTHRDWLAPGTLPADARVVALRLTGSDAAATVRAILAATTCNAFVFLGGRTLPSTSELQALVRFIEVSPRLGAIGLGHRAGHAHTVAALTQRIDTRVFATHRTSLAGDRAPASDHALDEPDPRQAFIDRLPSRGLALAMLIPAGHPNG